MALAEHEEKLMCADFVYSDEVEDIGGPDFRSLRPMPGQPDHPAGVTQVVPVEG